MLRVNRQWISFNRWGLRFVLKNFVFGCGPGSGNELCCSDCSGTRWIGQHRVNAHFVKEDQLKELFKRLV